MQKKTLAIIIPIYNEQKTIHRILKKVLKFKLQKNIKKKIFIYDDSSNDGSKDILFNFKNNKQIKIFFKKKNYGKGHTQKLALQNSEIKKCDFITIQDADLEYNPNDISRLLNQMIKDKNQFAIGYRNLKNCNLRSPYFFFRETAVNFLNFLINFLFDVKIKDCACCYRIFSKNLWNKLKPTGNKFDFDYSIICQSIKIVKSITQTSTWYKSRSYNEGKKAKWIVGFYAIKAILFEKFKF